MALPYPSPRMRCMLATGRRGGHDGQTCRRCCLPTYLPTGGTRWTASVTAAAAAAQGNGAGISERETKRPTFRAGSRASQPAQPSVSEQQDCVQSMRGSRLCHQLGSLSTAPPLGRHRGRFNEDSIGKKHQEEYDPSRQVAPQSSHGGLDKRGCHHTTITPSSLPPSLPPDQTEPTGNDPPFCRRL